MMAKSTAFINSASQPVLTVPRIATSFLGVLILSQTLVLLSFRPSVSFNQSIHPLESMRAIEQLWGCGRNCDDFAANLNRKYRNEMEQARKRTLKRVSKRKALNDKPLDDIRLTRAAHTLLGDSENGGILPQYQISDPSLLEDIDIAGLPKAGTSQLYAILSSHPQARPYHPEKKEWSSFRNGWHYLKNSNETTLHNVIHIDANGKEQVVETLNVTKRRSYQLENQLELYRFYQNYRPKADTRISINGVPKVLDVIIARLYLHSNKKLIHIFRDPADWLWSSFNFWGCEGDHSFSSHHTWTELGRDYRSPELFHEIIASVGKFACSSFLLEELRQRWETWALNLVNLGDRENILFLKNEDLLPHKVSRPLGLLDQLANFTGLDRRLFTNTSKIRNCNAEKGENAECGTKTNAYPIAGNRGMLPQTRKLVYLHYWDSCHRVAELYGIYYQDCLNAIK